MRSGLELLSCDCVSAEDAECNRNCSREDGAGEHCGRCSSCLRRWISLTNNGIDASFEHAPWAWDRVSQFYVAAMSDGTYPEHRAIEFWRAMASVGITPTESTALSAAEGDHA